MSINPVSGVIYLPGHGGHRVCYLSRNFGPHAAIVAGLESSTGDLVFLMDYDLEEQPEWLPRFHDELQRHHLDGVYGVQERRVSTTSANFLGEMFWKAIHFMSSVMIPHNPVTWRLMTRDDVNDGWFTTTRRQKDVKATGLCHLSCMRGLFIKSRPIVSVRKHK
ncbi:glycosyltransferase [Neorhizobium tomejilense]|uniref:glycosyltransferase n=1 Tax=Neorhizobium tomejilense TaxID=2093828 RepID=UPI00155F3E83|nr:glycosyltransferase [Neorhizobium tomejilense]